MTQFSYDPLIPDPGLGTIRLLELQPGNNDDPIRCSLVQACLTENPEFEAISYCWGSDQAVDRVLCHDGTYLPVNHSLSCALRRFRLTESSRWLWADAICINQSDAEEKSHQVNMMRQIYLQARRVLIWLGPQDGQDTLGPLLEIAQKLKAIEPSTLPKDHAARQRCLGFTDTHVLSLAALLSRPWFRRVWIVQEAALARDAILYCGPQSLAWQELCRLLDLESGVNIIGPNYQVGIDLVQGIRSHRTAIGNNASKTLLDVLLHHRPSLATDPKDKVYGFLGLCTDDIIQADYRLAPREVYKLLTTRYLLKDCNLEIITASSSPISAHPDSLPSWVPDWSATDVASPLALRTKLLSETSYYATGESKWTPKFSEDGDMLGVEAQFIDEIVELGPVRQPYRPITPDAKSLFKQLRTECNVSNSWHKICLGDASGWDSEYLTGETLFDVSWQILLAGCHPYEYETCREQSIRVWSMFRKYLLAHRLRLMPLWAFGLMDSIAKLTGSTVFLRRVLAAATANDFQARVRRAISFRRMMRSKKGYLGLAPALAQSGDRVVLLKGLSTPVVLRQGATHWELVGECYLHGIMHGQVFELEKCEEIWLV